MRMAWRGASVVPEGVLENRRPVLTMRPIYAIGRMHCRISGSRWTALFIPSHERSVYKPTQHEGLLRSAAPERKRRAGVRVLLAIVEAEQGGNRRRNLVLIKRRVRPFAAHRDVG